MASRCINSSTTLYLLRASACGVAAFVAAFLLNNYNRPCSPDTLETRFFNSRHEDLVLVVVALCIALGLPLWMLLHHRRVRYAVEFNYVFDALAFGLLFVPTICWGYSATSVAACDYKRVNYRDSICVRNVCSVVRVSMNASCGLMFLLLAAFIVAFHQARTAPPPPSAFVAVKPLPDLASFDVVLVVGTPRHSFTQVSTPTTTLVDEDGVVATA
ncbi:Aste57867_23142 [Aphanomyces stellatus]|uniref:Aste57867_23142 protein n=1 Tax=Aphanomyces stellatus TaxID=120398 RepID=A0A485LN01_9STRA|nr:hypothetical protein As57867_023071 [Aphanomyces stellatus]VFT99790.1 Aste57867_23142 [Aphanomyces stellatus]